MARIFLKIGGGELRGRLCHDPDLAVGRGESLDWLTLNQFLDGILLGFITPGPIIILSTFVGYRVFGTLGAGVATMAIFLPPILLIIFSDPLLPAGQENPAGCGR